MKCNSEISMKITPWGCGQTFAMVDKKNSNIDDR